MPLTPTGFDPRTQEELLTDLQAAERGAPALGPEIDYSDEEWLGQLNAILTASLTEIQEQIQEAYGAYDVDKAEDDALRNLGVLSGVIQGDATKSRAYLTLLSTPGTVLPTGAFVASTVDPSVRFQLAAGFTTTLTTHTGILFLAEFAGPVIAHPGELTTIVTTVAGWHVVQQPGEAIVGSPVESIPAFRSRIRRAPSAIGGSTVDGIRVDLENLNNTEDGSPIISVNIDENDGNETNLSGVPPHSFEPIIHDLNRVNNNTIAQRIWDSRPLGIKPFGNTAGIAIDGNGQSHVVAFTRPVPVSVLVRLTLKVDPEHAGSDDVAAAVVARAQADFTVGRDAVISKYLAAASGLPGVRDVTVVEHAYDVGSPVWTTAPLVFTTRQIADFSTANVTSTFEPFVDR